jgi:hypothetical protein
MDIIEATVSHPLHESQQLHPFLSQLYHFHVTVNLRLIIAKSYGREGLKSHPFLTPSLDGGFIFTGGGLGINIVAGWMDAGGNLN